MTNRVLVAGVHACNKNRLAWQCRRVGHSSLTSVRVPGTAPPMKGGEAARAAW
jgi:hypothetical protein